MGCHQWSAIRILYMLGPMVSPISVNSGRRLNRKTEKVEERNKAYYAKFPEDVERVKKIMQYLTENKVSLPSGYLTPSRFQQLGIVFGFHGEYPSRNSRSIHFNIDRRSRYFAR